MSRSTWEKLPLFQPGYLIFVYTYENNKKPLHREVTQECLNYLLGKIIKKNTDPKIYSKQIFEYANSKRLSKKQIDQVNKYIEERAVLVIQTAYRGYLERKGIKSLNQKSNN